jgi:SagB-type dehydrogenase family enzyme
MPKVFLAMLENGLIVAEGTEDSLLDNRYDEEWEWGAVAGLYHFSVKNANWVDQQRSHEFIASRSKTKAPPNLFEIHEQGCEVFELSRNLEKDEVLSLMASRRSSREFSRIHSLEVDVLSDCLFAGLGITEIRGIPPLGPYPLKMTPSGGARNPFDAVVYVRDVSSLIPGLYRYSGYKHSLMRTFSDSPLSIVDILGGQEWAQDAAAVIFLVANFDRTMWKYLHPSGYRVVLMEAGHIAQNIVLLATKHKIRSVTTAAIRDNLAEEAFGITSVSQSVCYAIALGTPLIPSI